MSYGVMKIPERADNTKFSDLASKILDFVHVFNDKGKLK